MQEVETIPQKHTKKSMILLIFLSFAMIAYAIKEPYDTASIIKSALCMAAERIIPSLLAFSIASKILLKCGLINLLEKLPLQGLYRILGVSAGGFASFFIGSLAGFPTGASVLADAVNMQYMKKEEARFLLPFCNNAGASFVIGVIGIGIFDSAIIGQMLFFAQIAASLSVLILMQTEQFKLQNDKKKAQSLYSSCIPVITSSISESIFAMLSVSGYIIFFSLCSNLFLNIIMCFLPISKAFSAFLTGLCELSNGLSLLSEIPLSDIVKIMVCGALLGFGGISVFLQASDRAWQANISSDFYLKGKICTMIFSAIFAPLFGMFSVYKFCGFLVFGVFILIFCIGAVKNLIIFKKTMEKPKRMLYNKNEL